MKKSILALLLSLMALTASYAQYYDNDPVGTIYHYEMSNKLMGTIKTTQTLVNKVGNDVTFEVVTEMPGMGKPMKMTNTMTFADGKITQDPQNIIEQTKASLAQSLGDTKMEAELKGDVGFTPLQGKPGDKLPLNKIEVTMKVQGMEIVTIVETLRNEITALEEVTTPVGTFEALKLETKLKTTTQVMGQNQKMDQDIIYWIVPNKGMVKSQTTSMGQTMTNELVKITRP